MSTPWVILSWRYGADTRNPTPSQLTEAIAELYHETLLGMQEGCYAEHGAASLRYGFDEGPMFVLEVNRLHEVIFEVWADQDYEQELGPSRLLKSVPEDHALLLWSWIARGEIVRVRLQPWDADPSPPAPLPSGERGERGGKI